jgi:predicted adenine nucleotide alpha hydrolase (AANH) superfamily ATPase
MKILLHACCAPCSTTAIETFEKIEEFKERILSETNNPEITVFFYNPNIEPREEYDKRFNEIKKLCNIKNIKLIEGPYDNYRWNELIKGYENCPEKGERCKICYEMRLKKTEEIAEEYYTTTLTVSPYKDILKINSHNGKKFLQSNFKKKDGYKRSIELSKEYDLYRQNYCGCRFSMKK